MKLNGFKLIVWDKDQHEIEIMYYGNDTAIIKKGDSIIHVPIVVFKALIQIGEL